MNKLRLIIILLGILISCESSDKYEYVEIVQSESLFGEIQKVEKDAEIINAKSDSIAYLEAYEKFCISEKVAQDMKEALSSTSSIPLDFKLTDEQGSNIALNANFYKVDSLKANIKRRIFSLKNSLEETVANVREEKQKNFINTVQIDSTKIKALKPYFSSVEDEFDPNGLVWHKPKSAPEYVNRNGIYCYFQTNNGVPSNLRLRLQYHADDWLFIEKVQFSIDGQAFEFIPRETETDSGNGGHIWEWIDQDLGEGNTELLNALANAKSAKMKLIGSQYSKVKTINKEQINDIKRSLELYNAMGGTY